MKSCSVQLFSTRHTPLEEALWLIARAGFTRVEGYEDLYASPRKLKAMLEHHGLAMPTGHFNLFQLRKDRYKGLKAAEILGMHTLICPTLPVGDFPADPEGWRAFGRELDGYRKDCEAAGFRFAWHNHGYEFRPLPDGSIPLTHLLAAAPEMDWQIDVAWVASAGGDPARWIRDFADRIRTVHLKDLAAPGTGKDQDGWADPGAGILNWDAIVAALQQSRATDFVFEHEQPGNLNRFLERAMAFAGSVRSL